MYKTNTMYKRSGLGGKIFKAGCVGLAMLAMGCTSGKGPAPQESLTWPTIAGTVLEDKLESRYKAGIPTMPLQKSYKGKGSYQFTIKTEEGKKITFFSYGNIKDLVNYDKRINPGDDVKVKYPHDGDKPRYPFITVE